MGVTALGCDAKRAEEGKSIVKHQVEKCKTLSTVEDFDAAVKLPRVVIHIDVDWAVQAIQSRAVVAEFFETVNKDSTAGPVAIRRLDSSEQSGPLFEHVAEWLKNANSDWRLLAIGCGAILWVRDGTVVASVDDARSSGLDALRNTTRKVFGRQAM